MTNTIACLVLAMCVVIVLSTRRITYRDYEFWVCVCSVWGGFALGVFK